MKKILNIVFFLILSIFSFGRWEVDRNYNMIFTSSIKTEPSQNSILYIRKGNYENILNYHSFYIITDKYPASTIKFDDESIQKTKVKLITEHPIEFERVGIVNIYKPNEIYVLLIDNEIEIFKKSKTLKIIYEDKNSTPCTLEFDITGLETEIKKIPTKIF